MTARGMALDDLMSSDTARQRKLESALKAGRFVMTAEVTPPVSPRAEDLLAKALPLKGLAHAVNVTDGAGARAHMGALAAAAILAANGIEPVLQFTCRDRNRIALQGDLLGAAALSIRNVLLLRGDDPAAGDQPEAKGVFDLDARALVETARDLRDRAELPSGRKLAAPADLFIGVADMPIDPPAHWTPDSLKAKLAAGAQFAQTQFCMDPAIVRRYMQRLNNHEITKRMHILIGVAPLKSAGSARWMREHLYGAIIPDGMIARMETARDAEAEGRKICIELIEELAEIPGVAGAHLMAPNNETAIADVLAAMGGRAMRRAEL